MNLPELYKEMARLTEPICRNCKPPYHCCSNAGCQHAWNWTKNTYGLEMMPSEVPFILGVGRVPFLTHHGCMVPPEYRPLCTIWLCKDAVKPVGYAELLKEIAEAERERFR